VRDVRHYVVTVLFMKLRTSHTRVRLYEIIIVVRRVERNIIHINMKMLKSFCVFNGRLGKFQIT